MRLFRFFRLLSPHLILCVCLNISCNTFAQEDVQEPNNTNDSALETRYISDQLFTYLRAGPSSEYRLLGSINAGSKVQVLQDNAQTGYTQIIDNRQRTGWIESKFLQQQISLPYQLLEATTLIEQKKESIEILGNELNALKQNLNKTVDQKAELNRQVTEQLEQIARLNESIEKRERTNNMQWFTRGTILAVICIIIGYVLGLTGRKKGTSNRLM